MLHRMASLLGAAWGSAPGFAATFGGLEASIWWTRRATGTAAMPRPRAISTDHHDAEEPPPNALELGSLSEGFFSEADANGDGMVTKAEFIQWHHVKKGRAPTDVDMKKFYDADTNGDGSISVAEFERYISKRRAPKLALQTSMAASGSDEPVPEPELAFGSLSEGESRPATPDDLLDSPSDCIDCTGSLWFP